MINIIHEAELGLAALENFVEKIIVFDRVALGKLRIAELKSSILLNHHSFSIKPPTLHETFGIK